MPKSEGSAYRRPLDSPHKVCRGPSSFTLCVANSRSHWVTGRAIPDLDRDSVIVVAAAEERLDPPRIYRGLLIHRLLDRELDRSSACPRSVTRVASAPIIVIPEQTAPSNRSPLPILILFKSTSPYRYLERKSSCLFFSLLRFSFVFSELSDTDEPKTKTVLTIHHSHRLIHRNILQRHIRAATKN